MQGGLLQRVCGAYVILGLAVSTAGADDVVATVNGRPITQADLHLEAVLRQIPEGQLDAHRDELIDDLIGQQLIAAFISRRQTRANPIELETQFERIEALIRRRGEDPKALFQRLEVTRDQLRKRLELSLAWDAYVEQVTSEQQLRDYFEEHRRQFDGTQLRAQHILLKAAPQDAAARAATRRKLTQLRDQIEAGEVTFAAAAKSTSQAPSAGDGGDVGYFGYRGTMGSEFADAAFALKKDEISPPVETRFGVHLIRITDERAGQLSLEDVRPQLIQQISRRMWNSRVGEDRPRATIERR